MTEEGAPHGRTLAHHEVTILFADIVGFTELCGRAGVEHAYAIVTGALRVLDDVARRHGGVVDKYLGDALMAVFGLHAGHETHGAAAVRAALEMQREVNRTIEQVNAPLPLGLKIGINTGRVVAGDLRGPVVREFHVLGDPTNVAARLKERTKPGEIIAGEATVAQARDCGTFTPLAPLQVKGKEAIVRAFGVAPHADAASSPAAPASSTTTVGREHERQAFARAVLELNSGQSRILLLTGPPGIGKTHLLHALLASVPPDRLAMLPIDATAVEGTTPTIRWADDVDTRPEAAFAELHRWITDPSAPPALWLLAGRGEAPVWEAVRNAAAASLRTVEDVVLQPLSPCESGLLLSQLTRGTVLPPSVQDTVLSRAEGVPLRLVFGSLLAPAIETEQARGGVERTTEAERRRATTLFADISGFTRLCEGLPLAEAYDIVTGCLQVLHETAVEYGGTVEKYLGDCVMAVFGVPVALEDAPRRAINAAIEMRRRVADYNRARGLASPLGVHVGIDTGLAIAGDVSGPMLREFALMGASVGSASLLKDVAPTGEIWVGRETHRLSGATFEWSEVDEDVWAQRGLAALPAYELRSTTTQEHRPAVGTGATLFPRMIGRDEELTRLRAALQRLHAGTGGIVGIFGDSGVGKSRLIAELTQSREVADLEWLTARAMRIGRARSFHPFIDLLGQWAEIVAADDPAARTQKVTSRVRAEMGEAADEVLPFIATFMGLPLDPDAQARVRSVSGDMLDRVVQRSMRALLAAIARARPTVVFFEDLYWADLSSIELLQSVLRLTAEVPLLLLFATRPGFTDTADIVAAAARKLTEHYTEIRLEPLDATTARQLLASVFEPGMLSRAARDRLERTAGGHPLFLEELLRSLIDDGTIEVTASGLRARGALDTLPLPDTLQGAVLARVDRLPAAAKQLIQLAAVVGNDAPPSLLAALANTADVDARLEQLEQLQLLARMDRDGEPRYRFTHRLIQESAYDAILGQRRQELHLAVAEALERRGPDGSPGFLGLLAHHFGLAQDVERAESYLLRAGDDAARTAASAEALELFQTAARSYLARHAGGGDPATVLALERRLAMACLHRGRSVEASAHFGRALELLGVHAPSSQRALQLGLVRSMAAVLPRLYLPRLRPRPPATAIEQDVLSLILDRARAQVTGDPDRFVFDTLDGLRRITRLDPRSVPGASVLFASAAGLFSYSGLSFDVAARLLDRAQTHLDRTDPNQQLSVAMMHFVYCFFSGDWRRDVEIPGDTLDAGIARGQLWDVATHLGLEGTKMVMQGRFDEARAHVRRVAHIEDGYAYDLARSNRHSIETSLLTEQRRLPEARAVAATYATERDEPLLNLLALTFLAKAQVLDDRLDEAAQSLTTAERLVDRLGTLPRMHQASFLRSRLLWELASALNQDAHSPAVPRTLVRLARRATRAASAVAWLQPEVHRLAAAAASWAGDRSGAMRSWERSLAAARHLETPAEGARTQIAMHAAGVENAATAEQGLRTLRALDLTWEVERVEHSGLQPCLML